MQRFNEMILLSLWDRERNALNVFLRVLRGGFGKLYESSVHGSGCFDGDI